MPPRPASQPLASIYDDEEKKDCSEKTCLAPNANSTNNSASGSTNKLKFTPTIPAMRRKKADPEPTAESTPSPDIRPSTARPYTRNARPLAAATSGSTAGPLALGPSASITAANRSRGPGSLFSESISAVRRVGSTSSVNTGSTQDTESFDHVLLVEDEFAQEPLDTLHPVAVKPAAPESFVDRKLDRAGLFLFQLPPVLPPFAEPQDSNNVATSEDPNDSQCVLSALQRSMDSAEHWPPTLKGRLGRFRRYYSGRMTLTIGNVELEVRPSALDPVSSHLTAVKIDPSTRSMVNLGQISGGHFNCFLDLSHTE